MPSSAGDNTNVPTKDEIHATHREGSLASDFRRVKEFLDAPLAARIRRKWFAYLCYGVYCVFHGLTFPLLAVQATIIARGRGYYGLIWRRLLGGSSPPARNEWTIIAGGGLGEVRTGWAFAETILDSRDPNVAVLVKSTAASKLRHHRIHTGVLPFSNPISVAIFLLRWRPKAVIAVEFFSNHHMIAMCSLLGIRTAVFNVPITERHAKKITYKKRWRQQLVGAFFCQEEVHRERLIQYGKVATDQAIVTGPVCLSIDPAQGVEATRGEIEGKFRHELRIPSIAFPVIVAGSTYHAEELMILKAFAELREEFQSAVLILAPRGLTRSGGCDSALIESGTDFVRRTQPFEELPRSRVVLLDTVGELKHVYSVGDVALVGGSFGDQGTGHTPVEAMAWGLPTLIGPHHPQQKTVVDILIGLDAIRICENATEIASTWREMSNDAEYRKGVRQRLETFRRESDSAVLDIYDTIVGA